MNKLNKARNRVSPPQPRSRFELHNKRKIIRGRIAAIGQGVAINFHRAAASYDTGSQSVSLHACVSSNCVVPEDEAAASNAIEGKTPSAKGVVFCKHETAAAEVGTVRPRGVPVTLGVVAAIPAWTSELDGKYVSVVGEQIVVDDPVNPALRLKYMT